MFYVYLLLFTAVCFGLSECFAAKDISALRKAFIRRYFEKPVNLPSLFQRVLKRFTDVVVSFFVCLTILPLLYVVLGTIIKLTSRGPVIFRQKRIGLAGREFVCFKFRSMYLNNQDIPASYNDARITPVGRIIRKTHLDEFPQFFNVLIGDMSLVGPRPATATQDKLLLLYHDYPYRLLLRPGITGLSQINSGRFLRPQQIIRYDVLYISRCSWFLDMKIIFETLKFKDRAL